MSRVIPILLITGLLCILLSSTATATVIWYKHSWNGTGVFSATYGPQTAIQYTNDGDHNLYGEWYFTMHSCTFGDFDQTWIQVYQPTVVGYVKTCPNLPFSDSGGCTITYPTGIMAITNKLGSDGYVTGTLVVSDYPSNTISGSTGCINEVSLYVYTGGDYIFLNSSALATTDTYSFNIYNQTSYRIVFDGVYHDFVGDGSDVTFDYGECIWVYGYTCGVDTIKLYNDTAGWVLDDSVGQSTGYDVYEMLIVDGEDYKISFIDSGTAVHNQTFSCTGDHVLIDYDRCRWVYPPSPWADPYIIYLWTGYDYNIVVFKDNHGNFIENSQLAIYDKTDNKYIQRWTDASDGYTLLGARFDIDHDVRLTLRTFDGIFTLDTTYPANGSALVGEEEITTTNWTIPIKYNLNVLPVDQYGISLFDVFCGLSEYTPLNPGAFWGMDLSDQGYVAVTNCSGFAMCDIIAEKDGYADYKVEALNWTSKSALVKDYRHNVVMEEE